MVLGKSPPCLHLGAQIFHLVFAPALLRRRRSKQVARWASGSQHQATIQISTIDSFSLKYSTYFFFSLKHTTWKPAKRSPNHMQKNHKKGREWKIKAWEYLCWWDQHKVLGDTHTNSSSTFPVRFTKLRDHHSTKKPMVVFHRSIAKERTPTAKQENS